MNLSDRQWSAFSLGNTDIFNLHSTLNGIDKNKLNLSGKNAFPYVTRTDKNNGITNFIPEQSKDINPGNTISIGLDTQTVFYQPKPYYTGQNIQILSFQEINTKTAIFLIPLIKKQLENLNWGGNGATLSRLKAKKILLPTTSKNQPDWQFMEDYITEKIGKYNIPSLESSGNEPLDLNGRSWNEFKISDVMNILSGVRLTSSDMAPGNIPFIGASDANNGITNWTSNINSSTDSNILGINYNGSVGEVFYHPYIATFSDDVKRLKLKKITRASKEVYLFIKTVLLQQKNKYAYGYKFNTTRLKAQKIMLPVTNDNIPDWKFMADYIKSLPNSKLL